MYIQLIAGYLRELRKKHGYTQEELAKNLTISRQAVSKWETGNTIPDLEVLLKLSHLYSISINEILEPVIEPEVIHDFEEILNVGKLKLKEILRVLDRTDIIKASMGASPQTNALLAEIFPDICIEQEQLKLGRIKVEEVETAQNQIVAFINLSVKK